MEISSALALVNALVFKPGWEITATDHTNRFEGTIKVRIDYPARSSEKAEAPEFAHEIMTYASFALIAGDCEDDTAIYRRVLDAIVAIDIHEDREFLRVAPTMWAPFHPHRIDGMKRWGQVETDLHFGVC